MSEAPLVSSAGRARLTRIEQVMGMGVIVEVCDPGVDGADIERAFRWLRHVDATFSTYDAGSEISRLNRGELEITDASFEVRSVLARCESLRRATNGFFDIAAATGAEGVDPSGLVKGWAVLGAARLLEQAGARSFCVDAGGDIIVSGHAPQGGAWRIGVAHPRVHDAVACTLALSDCAIATSGAYARGGHIVNPHTGAAAAGLLSVTVVGADLPTADAFATAAFAMGSDALEWCVRQPGYEFMIITEAERVMSTEGFARRRITDRGRTLTPVAALDRQAARTPAAIAH